MIVNGKDVEVDFRGAERIQTKIDNVSNLPDSTKVEVNRKEIKELENIDFSSMDSFNGYSIQNNTLLTGSKAKENRKDYYNTFQEMSETNFIHRGLQVIADDCSQKNEEGNVIKVLSDDDDIKEILDNLFNKRLNMNKEIWSIFYETCKLGDNFYEVIPDDYKNPKQIARIRYLEPERVNRIESNGKLAFYTYTSETTNPEQSVFQVNDKKEDQKVIYKLEPWQIIHFRITDKDFYPYGGSLLKSGVKCFRYLQLLEDGMLIYRLVRVPERRVFKIDMGNLPQSEANRQLQKIKDNYRTTQILDDRGNINRTASALSLNQDIFIPVREGGSGTSIETLQAGAALNNIDDIRYFRDQILWTMNIPPEKLGFTSDQAGAASGRGSLAMNDINFSRFCGRIQYYIEEGLNKLAAIELFFNGKKKEDLSNFKIELTPSSNIKEVMDIEYLNQKMTLIQSMIATGMFSKKFILKYVMRLSKKEIDDLLFFKEIEDNGGAVNGANGMTGDMGGGMPMGGGMDTGGAPMDNSGAGIPQMSVKTEEVDTEKIVRLFGKDILIEHKEDFAKLLQAADDYNKSLLKPKEEPEETEEDLDDNDFIKVISEAMGNKKIDATNNRTLSLVYENELNGLNWGDNSITLFERKKRRGPKKNNIIYEEKNSKFKY